MIEKVREITRNRETEKYWYALYTKPRSEKQVFKRFSETGIDSYLPLQKTLKQWSDRKKLVEVPLFSSYVFVYINLRHYETVLKTPGVVKFIRFGGRAVPIPQKQIDILKLIIESNTRLETTSVLLTPGQQVEVILGALKGLRGELVKPTVKNRFLVRIDAINKNIMLNIPDHYLQSIAS
jgi:transcription antitermination factor NusG